MDSIEIIHPITNERIPVFAASYVLAGYGNGVVMGVPAHDDWDKSFAEINSIPTL